MFIHQSFPGQFKHLAPELVRHGHDVTALVVGHTSDERHWNGVRVVKYQLSRGSTSGVHPWVSDIEAKVIRGEACFKTTLALKAQGYTPDVVIAHPGWGESLFIKDVWPEVKLGIYCEFFYQIEGCDAGFDAEFERDDPGNACRLRLKNLNNFLHIPIADKAISPTQWQANTFPESIRSKTSVIHDGIDTDLLCPGPDVTTQIQKPDGSKLQLSRQDEVITFVNRNLEPHRGYHVFMRALPDLLKTRPKLRVLIVGGDGVSYGAKPDPNRYGNRSWKDIFIDEVKPLVSDTDWARVHFLGSIPYPKFVGLLQLSRVHVYLTYPFVLSWSLLEAMSAGCAIVASDTAPVREVIEHDVTGSLVDFFDPDALGLEINRLLDDPRLAQRYGAAARAYAIEQYDLRTVCLPAQLAWVESLGA